MIMDDIIQHVRNCHLDIEQSLLRTRRSVAGRLGRTSYSTLRLDLSEVSRAVEPFMASFFKGNPDYASCPPDRRAEIIRKLDKLKICMFMLQFPQAPKDVLETFRFEIGEALYENPDAEGACLPLVRAIEFGLEDDGPMITRMYQIKDFAEDAIARLPDNASESLQRALMDVIGYAVHAFPNSMRREDPQPYDIQSVHDRPANDNYGPEPMRMR